MYLTEPTPYGLCSNHGHPVALQMIKVDASLNDLLTETTLTQIYRNTEQRPIEAVYTFALNSRAVILGLQLTIGDRTLHGLVVAKSIAEEDYEQAIADGDSAIMLEQVQQGLYVMNVGNLLPGEEVMITLRTGSLHDWQGNSLRFHLPTTIAPRYGTPEAAGVEPHQSPEHDLLVENRFQLCMTLNGNLAKAKVESPSHRIAISPSNSQLQITLTNGTACMDRDFIVNITLPSSTNDLAIVDHDLDGGYVTLASFNPRIPEPQVIEPRSIKIVVDCSGSMAGDAIHQARQAISDMLNQLRPDDHFNILAFGSHAVSFFPQQVAADTDHITKARRKLRSLEADMGGTEMEKALKSAVNLQGPAILQDILLITDGEIWQSEELIDYMKTSNHRVFTIGVGSSVSESFIRELAEATSGACELVVPNENMTEKIVRHFHRLYRTRATAAEIAWSTSPVITAPAALGQVFDGDTVRAFAWHAERPEGTASLALRQTDGSTLHQTVRLESDQLPPNSSEAPSTLARLARYSRLQDLSVAEATQMALRYQLITPFTNFLIIHQRAEDSKSTDLPQLRKVPQMLAAGWGGTGSVVDRSTVMYSATHSARIIHESSAQYSPAGVADTEIFFSRGLSPEELAEMRQRITPSSFMYECERHTKRSTTWLKAELHLTSLSDLLACDLPDRIHEALVNLIENTEPPPAEEEVVVAFLWVLHQSVTGTRFDRTTIRSLKKAKKRLKLGDQLIRLVRNTFPDIRRDDWGSGYPITAKEKSHA